MSRYGFTVHGVKRVLSQSAGSACLTVVITHVLNKCRYVIPAKAGIQNARLENAWIPVYAPKAKEPMAQAPFGHGRERVPVHDNLAGRLRFIADDFAFCVRQAQIYFARAGIIASPFPLMHL